MKNSGFFWHLHHDVLLEWCHSYNGRVEFICIYKAKKEQEIRLRIFQPVKGDLPQEVIETGRVYDEAWRAYNDAKRACDETRRVYDETRRVRDEAWRAYNDAKRACDEAWRAYYETKRVYDEAWQAHDKALKKNISAIETLHAVECPNCPWDGHTIFPK